MCCVCVCVFNRFFPSHLQGLLVVQPDQMQVSYESSLSSFCLHSFKLLLFEERGAQWNLLITIYYSFLKDFQPHSDIAAGAHHGQCDLSSDQEMWPELHVSARRQRTRCNSLPYKRKPKTFFCLFTIFLPFSSCCMTRPLKRMTVGMVLASIAFICAALVQLEIDVSRTVFYSVPTTQLSWFDAKFMLLLCFSRKLCQPSRPPHRLSWD